MIAGMVYLYDRTGVLVDMHPYRGRHERKRIIKKWKEWYVFKFNRCYLQYAPQTNISKINPDGTNKKTRNRITY